MAFLTLKEFERSIQLLADEQGLDRLRDKFFKLRGLVTRRGFKSADNLAAQIYQLSGGLRREVPSNYAFQAIWSEHIGTKVGEGAEERFEKLAEAVNVCLAGDESILADKRDELAAALHAYEAALTETIGQEMARLDMILKAVPEIAELLRQRPLSEPLPAPANASAPAAESTPPAAE